MYRRRAALARTLQQETIRATSDGVLAWPEQRLGTTAEVIGQVGILTAGVRKVSSSTIYPVGGYRTASAVELWVRHPAASPGHQHVLRFSFCIKGGGVSVRVQFPGAPPAVEPPLPQHSDVAILPTYAMVYDSGNSNRQILWHLFTADGGVHPHVPPQPTGPIVPRRAGRPNPFDQPPKPVLAQMCQFTTEAWPGVVEHFSTVFEQAIDTFTKTLERTL